MKKLFIPLLLAGLCPLLSAQDFLTASYRKAVRPTRNVIFMITDGTSIDVLSTARWFKIYKGIDDGSLAVDPWICGTTRTYSSNAPIVDSAPAMSAFTTGMPQISGNIAIYPKATEQDIIAVDPKRAYQPLATILEGAKQEHKATGIVVTVEFPHATPAATAAHGSNRKAYDRLAPQMVFQDLDVCFGGGINFLGEHLIDHLRSTGTACYLNDLAGFRAHNQGKAWSLWCNEHMPYVLDADTTQLPSLAEMTEKAIQLLNQHEEGFFLMVEGSKVDWAAHGNDAMGCITEYLDFDEAVRKAIDFAQRDGNTTVVITADHGNSGFTLGRKDLKDYSRASLDKLMSQFSKVNRSIYGLEEILRSADKNLYHKIFEEHAGFSITDEEIDTLYMLRDNRVSDYMKAANVENMVGYIAVLLNRHNWIGFTTGGHTGEETFLACYNPNSELPIGMNQNYELNQYLQAVVGTQLAAVTDSLFVPAADVFRGAKLTVTDQETSAPMLHVQAGKTTLHIRAYESVAMRKTGKKQTTHPLGSLCIYMPENNTFYLPRSAAQLLK